MTPIINPWLFYLVDVIGNLKLGSIAIPLILALSVLIGSLPFAGDISDEQFVKAAKKLLICVVCGFTVWMVLPSQETCYKMMVASQVTEENIQKAEDVIKDSVDYIFEKINEK